MDAIKELVVGKLPMIIRYALLAGAGWLANQGLMSDEQNALFSSQLDVIVAAIVALVTIAWGWKNKPSVKAQEVARQVDNLIPAGQTVTIQTPQGLPDIRVAAK